MLGSTGIPHEDPDSGFVIFADADLDQEFQIFADPDPGLIFSKYKCFLRLTK